MLSRHFLLRLEATETRAICMQARIKELLVQGDAMRQAGRWSEALISYRQALAVLPHNAALFHNMALCALASFGYDEALELSDRALRLNCSLWQSSFVKAKALIGLNRHLEALQILRELHDQAPDLTEVRVELAKLLFQYAGAAAKAYALVRPLLDTQASQDALMVGFISQLYDRPAQVSPKMLSDSIVSFSRHHLARPLAKQSRRPPTKRSSRRLRIGLVSPQWFVSPVYFFAYGALRHLADYADLIFFDRGTKSDWATEHFRAIANRWVSCSTVGAQELTRLLELENLDVLVDLGGWMDPVALHALASKPARRMFKWVGGQSATTGLEVFDGFLSDKVQTPRHSESLYSEPLVRLRSGYVTYTPPPYLPQPVASQGSSLQLGVISNPVKVSQAFLEEIAAKAPQWVALNARRGRPLSLHFIDHRYKDSQLRQRITSALPSTCAVKFLSPATHIEYLTAVRNLDAVLDTWPYCGGLTTMEALAMGVPVLSREGRLFCERHSWSHFYYAGLDPHAYSLEAFGGIPPLKTGRSLLHPSCKRLNHVQLAQELFRVFQ